jgi:hypothetical protein
MNTTTQPAVCSGPAPIPKVHELRACQLCSLHTQQDSTLMCTHPLVALYRVPVACTTARTDEALCGRDARRQHWPLLDLQLQMPAQPLHTELWACTS